MQMPQGEQAAAQDLIGRVIENLEAGLSEVQAELATSQKRVAESESQLVASQTARSHRGYILNQQ